MTTEECRVGESSGARPGAYDTSDQIDKGVLETCTRGRGVLIWSRKGKERFVGTQDKDEMAVQFLD